MGDSATLPSLSPATAAELSGRRHVWQKRNSTNFHKLLLRIKQWVGRPPEGPTEPVSGPDPQGLAGRWVSRGLTRRRRQT